MIKANQCRRSCTFTKKKRAQFFQKLKELAVFDSEFGPIPDDGGPVSDTDGVPEVGDSVLLTSKM